MSSRIWMPLTNGIDEMAELGSLEEAFAGVGLRVCVFAARQLTKAVGVE
jgi:hypothetical protein